MMAGHQIQPIKKGSSTRATLCQFAGDYQPLGSMPRDCSSLRSTRLIQVARDESPSLRISPSSCARKSSGSLIWYCGDFFNSCIDTCNYPYYDYHQGNDQCNYLLSVKQRRPAVLPTHTGRLTSNVKRTNAMAMPKCTQTHPEFTSRSPVNPGAMVFTFAIAPRLARLAALSRCRIVRVTAGTEQQARASLAAIGASGEAIGLSLVFMSRRPEGRLSA